MNTALLTTDHPNRFPVSIKAVLFTEAGEVVLLKNDRGEWELPGGRLEAGETPPQCLLREIDEELGVAAEVGALLDAYVFEVIPGRHVFIVTYACQTVGAFRPVLSDEHLVWTLCRPDALPENLPAGYRESIIRAMPEQSPTP
ncbi:MAG: NUDIX hydrolase [Betaproteobacteria bacterium]|nr:NUDIX hydrolase [Betaproteobacteria bacterium]